MKEFVCFALGVLTCLSAAVDICRAEDVTPGAGPPAPRGLSCEFLQSPNSTVIYDPQPEFAWVCGADSNAYTQAAYRIQVQRAGREFQNALLWDSGRVASDRSINVEYGGAPLEANGQYVWRVRSWNAQGDVSPWSELQEFRLASQPTTTQTSRYMVEQSAESPIHSEVTSAGEYFVDFGRAAFGSLKLRFPKATSKSFTLNARFGERLAGDRIDQNPGGTIRCYEVEVEVPEGSTEFDIRPPANRRNTSGAAILLPEEIGVVAPFRYVELSGMPDRFNTDQLERIRVDYPFNEAASKFESSDDTLNAIWRLCKYSIRATTFCGVYVDGDRERIPYEADAYINQLSHYCVDSEYALARHSHEYLLQHPTWPTEWKQHSILMAWEDFMYTGNTESLEINYEKLKREKLLTSAERSDGLLDTSTGEFRDIVDWPGGERDRYDMRKVNTVVNAFHYATLVRMAKIAEVLGRSEDSAQFQQKAESFKVQFNQSLWDESRECYVDGLGSRHSSVHANLFPLAFDLVPSDRVEPVVAFLERRGMRCSVYAAQYLLDGLYQSEQPELGLQLLTSKKKRSWYNMIRVGSTITLEAWDQDYKRNLDWNHAWGAAPANLIPRHVVGVRPLEPGFKKIVVQPQPASLQSFSAKVPTIRGPVVVDYTKSQSDYRLDVSIPGNTMAEIGLPTIDGQVPMQVVHNGNLIEVRSEGQHHWIDDVPPGTHVFEVALEGDDPPQAGILEAYQPEVARRGSDTSTDGGD
ncbi:alpha-L-rhamnosidase C-terminal domain-containing protein [Aeoliella sp.]|uniref:alpha-L-rhamnosidase-related protein n=1 Tax=Aeoliella sp. TaxID=2795800 RepID=UPI003CCC41DD